MADGWQQIVIEGEDLYYNATTGETSVVIPDDPVADAYAPQPASPPGRVHIPPSQ